jgi:hypothetical protein
MEDTFVTRILRNSFRAALLASTAIMLAGCPSGVGANIPGTGGSMGGTTTTPGGTTTTPATGAAACTAANPSQPGEAGTSIHGEYDKQLLPATWADTYKSEQEVTNRFRQAENGPDWNCMLKFYQGATSVYLRKK